MDPLDLLRTLFGRWRVIAAAALIALAAAAATTVRYKPPPVLRSFEATTVLVSSNQGDQGVSLTTLALLAKRGPVPEKAKAALAYPGPAAQLAQSVSVVPDPETGALEITGKSSTAAVAVARSTAFADGLLEYLEEKAAQRRAERLSSSRELLDRIQGDVDRLDRRIRGATGSRADIYNAQRDAKVRQLSFAYDALLAAQGDFAGAGLDVLQKAEAIPVARRGFVAPRGRTSRMIIATIIGLMFGTGIALGLERLDVRLRSREQVEEALGYPILAEIPMQRRLLRGGVSVHDSPRSEIAAAFRLVRAGTMPRALDATKSNGNGHAPATSALGRVLDAYGLRGHGEPAQAPPPPNTFADRLSVLVTSAGGNEGKTTVAANLAATFAEMGRVTLAVSADLRRSGLAKTLGIAEEPGLIQAIKTGNPASSVHVSKIPGVLVIPSGGTVDNPAATLGSKAAREAFGWIEERAQVTVVDSTGLLDASDASSLLPLVDRVVVVIRVGRTTAGDGKRLSEFLRRMDASVAGVVMVGTRRNTSPTLRELAGRVSIRRRRVALDEPTKPAGERRWRGKRRSEPIDLSEAEADVR